jgi:phosphoglycolate phosphatase-like HAD superfamily hydrolase
VILLALGIRHPAPNLLEELNRPLEAPPIEAFPDVRTVLEQLQKRRIRMAIVTDYWGTAASVQHMHDQIGLAGFF